MVRFPRRESRWIGLLRVARGSFDGRGAVVGGELLHGREPARRRRCDRTSVAATTSPTPKISVRVVPDAATAARIRTSEALRWRVAAGDVVDEFAGEAMPFGRDRVGGFDASRGADEACETTSSLPIPPGTSSPTSAWSRHTALFRAQRRSACAGAPTSAGPSHGPRPGPATNAGARNAAIATDRASLGSFLSDRPAAQQPHPRRQHRRDVHDVFTRGEELLRQQIAEPTRGLDRPCPCRVIELVGPCDQLAAPARRRAHQPFTEHHARGRRQRPPCASACADRYRSSPSRSSDSQDERGPRWALLIRDVELLTSFEPHRGRTQQPRNSYRKPTRTCRRQAVREQRPLDSTDATNNAATPPPTQSGSYGACPRVCRALGGMAVSRGARNPMQLVGELRRSSLNEGHQVGVDGVGVGGAHAVRIARVHLQRAVL